MTEKGTDNGNALGAGERKVKQVQAYEHQGLMFKTEGECLAHILYSHDKYKVARLLGGDGGCLAEVQAEELRRVIYRIAELAKKHAPKAKRKAR